MMRRKKLHVVFGRFAPETFRRSAAFNPDEIELICLEDTLLNVGPLGDTDSSEVLERRKKWLVEMSEDPMYPVEEWIDGLIENDRKTLAFVLNNPDRIDVIYLWTGFCAGEILAAARFVSAVEKLGKPMFQINFPNIPVRIWNGDIIYPESLAVMAPENIHPLIDHFNPLSDKDMEAYRGIWRKACSTDSLLRIRDTVSSRKIRHVGVDYFDHFLLLHCTGEFQKAARVIGETIADVSSDGGFLGWRLKQLCRTGMLEYKGELKALRDFEVRKTNG